LPGVETLQVARTPLLSVRPFIAKVGDSSSWRKEFAVFLSFVPSCRHEHIPDGECMEIPDLRPGMVTKNSKPKSQNFFSTLRPLRL
jgi:hypothetical protein